MKSKSLVRILADMGLSSENLPTDLGGWQKLLKALDSSTEKFEFQLFEAKSAMAQNPSLIDINSTLGQARVERILSDSIAALDAGFAIFDNELNLLICNKMYRNLYEPEDFKLEPGVSYSDLLRILYKTDLSIAKNEELESWINKRLLITHQPKSSYEEHYRGKIILRNEFMLPDGRLISLCLDNTERRRDFEKLRENEKTLQSIVASLEDIIIEVTPELLVKEVWKAPQKSLSIANLLEKGKHLNAIFSAELTHKLATVISEVLKTGNVIEFDFRDAKESAKWYRSKVTKIVDPTNSEIMITVSLSDITGHRSSRERLRIAMSAIKMGVFEWDLSTQQMSFDDSIYELFGLKRTEIELNQDVWKSLVHPDDLDLIKLKIEQAAPKTRVLEFEYRIMKSRELVKTIAAKAHIERSPNNQPIRIISINYDLTDQRRAQEEISSLNSLVESSEDMIAYWDLEGNLKFLNSAAKTNLGWRFDLNKIYNYMPERYVRLLKTYIFPGYLEFGKQWEGETEFVNPQTQEKILVLQRIFCLRDQKGEINYIATVATDVRQRKSAELKLIQSSKMASLGEMAGGIAHEINNPVAIIKTQASQLRRADNEKLTKEYVTIAAERIERTADRIDRIVKGLKLFSRNADKDPFVESKFFTIIKDTVEFCQERFKSQSVNLICDYSKIKDLNIQCRPSQISQVVLNLLNNAYDAVNETSQPWVKIEFAIQLEHIVISVSDSGKGIPSDIADKIMEPFFTTKDVGKGTGLGLSITKGIVEAHSGRIYLDKEFPNTRFVVELPLTQTDRSKKAS